MTIQPSSPPCAAEPGILRIILRELREIAAALDLLQNTFGLRFHRRVVRGVGLDQDVPRLHPLRRAEFVLARVVFLLQIGVRDGACAIFAGSSTRMPRLRFSGVWKARLVRIVVRLDLGFGRLGFGLELCGRQQSHIRSLILSLRLWNSSSISAA